jgi:hypothetical protein
VTSVPIRGGFRFLSVSGAAGDTLKDARVQYTARPVDVATIPGSFLSTDETLNRAYFVGLNTLLVCTIPPSQGDVNGDVSLSASYPWVIVDGAKRDRMVWNGDLAVAAATTWATLDNDPMVGNSMLTNSNLTGPSGIIPASRPYRGITSACSRSSDTSRSKPGCTGATGPARSS